MRCTKEDCHGLDAFVPVEVETDRAPALDLSRINDRSISEVNWLLEDFIPEAAFVLLAAGWKTGKTFAVWGLLGITVSVGAWWKRRRTAA